MRTPAPEDAARPGDGQGEAGGLVTVGRISGLYGVLGWVKVFSETDPPEGILGYRPWLLVDADGRLRETRPLRGRQQGRRLIAQLDGCADRDAAAALVGREIRVPRAAFPPPGEDEYYWADLVGLAVRTTEGLDLGRIERLFATGANDVMVVQGERERLIPFTPGNAVREVDLVARRVTVAWDPDF